MEGRETFWIEGPHLVLEIVMQAMCSIMHWCTVALPQSLHPTKPTSKTATISWKMGGSKTKEKLRGVTASSASITKKQAGIRLYRNYASLLA